RDATVTGVQTCALPIWAANGNFALSDFSVALKGAEIKIASAKADFEQKGLPITAAIDADKTSAWAIDPQFGKDHAAAFVFQNPLAHDGLTELTIRLRCENKDKHAM